MRSEAEVEDYEAKARLRVFQCKQCQGKDPDCACHQRVDFQVACFEACIPRDFWGTTPGDVQHNRQVFDGVVRPYCAQIVKARVKGYGLLFLGDNGVGKTFFMAYVLTMAITSGLTVYYTTLPRLDYDWKRGFNDREVSERLRVMLTSDFLAIDEMGKEKFKDGDTYFKTQVERVLKERFDDSLPTIIATNASLDGLEKIYGATLTSILQGKYQVAMMEPGDFRKQIRQRMTTDMGY